MSAVSGDPDEPVKGWRNAYAVLKISPDTGERHRRKYGDRTLVAWWPNAAAVKAWYQALIAPPPTPARPTRRRLDQGPIDPRAVASGKR